MNQIVVPRQKISSFCEENGIRRLSFFGSVLRDDFHYGSDIDVLVEFDSSRRIGFLAMARMEMELTRILGVK
jgi:predicted nucleotidyltransferase